MEYLCKYLVYRVDVLQELHVVIDDVTIATYWLLDLYLPKMKNALFNASEFNTLSSACAV